MLHSKADAAKGYVKVEQFGLCGGLERQGQEFLHPRLQILGPRLLFCLEQHTQNDGKHSQNTETCMRTDFMCWCLETTKAV